MSSGTSYWLRVAAIATLQVAALVVMWQTEYDLYGITLYLLTWIVLNCFWLVLFRRPGISAALTLVLFTTVIVLSLFKSSITWMTISFLDLLIIDSDTIAFLWSIFPDLRTTIIVSGVLALPTAILIWRIDPLRIRRGIAAIVGVLSLAGLTALSLAVPEEPTEPFQGVNHVSNFARSGALAAHELATMGWLEFDLTPDRLRAASDEACRPDEKPPNVILILDEASFDIRAVPGIKVPAGYGEHFKSFDGRARSLLVEGSGGPTWYTEYNVLTGLSARSYGRLKFYVTRIAADRVERGLPHALRRCGYKTFSLYPTYGAFLSARRFQATTGIDRMLDLNDMRSSFVERDSFYYDQAARLLARERDGKPKFVFVYTTANHFPWYERLFPEATPEWRDLGNPDQVDEYIRRQVMSAGDYQDFLRRLEREFPDERFLLVRFGDHQPFISHRIIDPTADQATIARRMAMQDPRYFTTYYAIDAVNFTPVDTTSAQTPLEAVYLPLVILEAAGLPIDPSFVEQKRILNRCRGLFYTCAGGAEARRFNRLLVDAGLIKGLVSR
jgi:hypothetical protein